MRERGGFLHNSEEMRAFMERVGFPREAADCFTAVFQRLDDEPDFGKAMDRAVRGYMYPFADNIRRYLKKVDALAERKNVNPYTLEMVFLLSCTPILKKRYKRKGIDEQIFWDTMDDLRCKLLECMRVKGVPGTFVAGWYNGFFDMSRFALGRFQFEHSRYRDKKPYTLSCGVTVKKGDRTIGFHIPSSGVSLTEEVRLDSYKKAFEFFKKEFHGGPVIFSCGSWLLYPRHREFLPEGSHILEFMDDFEIPFSAEQDKFHDAWRVFGADADLPPEQLPRDTALQRAFADWLMAGNKTGDGWGLFCFDGEKIMK